MTTTKTITTAPRTAPTPRPAAKVRKGEQTRQRIVERAAPVFNQRGYAGTSLAELIAATGLEKGGIYNHFASKDELALAAFDHAVSLLVGRNAAAQVGHEGLDRLTALIAAFGTGSTIRCSPADAP